MFTISSIDDTNASTTHFLFILKHKTKACNEVRIKKELFCNFLVYLSEQIFISYISVKILMQLTGKIFISTVNQPQINKFA